MLMHDGVPPCRKNRSTQKGMSAALCMLVFFLCTAQLSAAGSNLFRKKDLKVIKTAWFDIIYPPASEQAANMLAGNADKMYSDITATLNRKPWFRLPVVITPATDTFNAYYSNSPYNHIVMYDTPAGESMAVYSRQFLSTFRHELTHAVTFNLKSPFWRKADAILGDYYNPGILTLTTAVSEGVTVSFESLDGGGRLNNGYSLQMIRQAKIENVFPGWADIQGAKFMYPQAGESYIFGGAFAAWLQNTYGMEKYAQYWEQMVNLKSLTYFTAFKKVYGMPIEDAWGSFKDSVTVPDIPSSPLEKAGYGDLFTMLGTDSDTSAVPQSGTFSKPNTGGALYEFLTASPFGIAWKDMISPFVWYSPRVSGSDTYGKPEKLFSLSGISRLSLSADGRYLAVSFTSSAAADTQNKVSVYELKQKRWFPVHETGLRDAAVITSGKNSFLAAVKTRSQYADIKLYRLEIKSGESRIRKITEEKTIYHHFGDIPFSLTDGGNGTLAYIYKTGLQWSIRRYDMQTGSVSEYKTGEDRLVMRNLSLASSAKTGTDLLFSFSRPATLPRLGQLHIAADSAMFSFQKDDVSGGIHYPVPFKQKERIGPVSSIAYIGTFYRDFKLLYADTSELPFSTEPAQMQKVTIPEKRDTFFKSEVLSETAGTTSADKNITATNADAYNAFDYYRKGLLWPFTSRSMMVKSNSITETSSIPIGLAYVTGDPWDGSQIAVSAAYDIFGNSCIASFQESGGTSTTLFNYLVQTQVEFDEDGYKQTYNKFNLASSLPSGRISRITVSDTVEVFEGRQNKRNLSVFNASSLGDMFNLYKNPDDTAHLFAQNKLAAEWSTIHSAGLGVFGSYSRSGISVTPSYKTNYYAETYDSFDNDNLYKNISLETELCIPGLLPVISTYPDQYNIPLSATAELFPSSSYFLDTGVTLWLYSHQIQKTVSFLPMLYAQNFAVTASYTGQFSYGTADSWDFFDTPELTRDLVHGKMDYYDAVRLTALVLLSPNIGTFAKPTLQLPLFVSLLYRIRPEDDDNHWELSFTGFILL